MLYVLCYMKIKNLISVKIEIFFSQTYYMYIFRLFLSYIVLNRSFLYIFVTNIHIYQHGLTPRRVAEAPGPRALRAGRRQAWRRAGRQPASTALDKPRSDGSPRAGG